MTRVPTYSTANTSVRLLTQLSASLARAQEQIATGRAILTPADDPAGAAQALLLEQSINALDTYSRNADIVEPRLQRQEAALTSAGDLLQRARELIVQAANASQSDESRGFIAVELREIREQLFQTANSSDGNGRFLFSGFQTDQPPFVESSGVVAYRGDEGQRQIQVGAERFIADGDHGADLFMRIPRANGVFSATTADTNTGSGTVAELGASNNTSYNYSDHSIRFTAPDQYEILDSASNVVATGSFADGDTIEYSGLSVRLTGQPETGDEFGISPAGKQSIFATLDQLEAALGRGRGDAAANARVSSELNRGLENIDQALGRVLETRTDVGARLSVLDSQRDLNDGYKLLSQDALGDIQDLDYTEAITTLSQQLTALEAAQKTFARIQGLSLFNVL